MCPSPKAQRLLAGCPEYGTVFEVVTIQGPPRKGPQKGRYQKVSRGSLDGTAAPHVSDALESRCPAKGAAGKKGAHLSGRTIL